VDDNFLAGRAAVSDYVLGKLPYSAAVRDWIELNHGKRIRA
jgi:hypothetical protein